MSEVTSTDAVANDAWGSFLIALEDYLREYERKLLEALKAADPKDGSASDDWVEIRNPEQSATVFGDEQD